MTIEARIADALRVVGLKLEMAIEEGHRSSHVDASDLLETLFAVADELDPQTAEPLRADQTAD